MNNQQKHIYGLLMDAAGKLRAVQMYGHGQGAGHTTNKTDNLILTALTSTWAAIREIEKSGTIVD